MKVVSLNVGVPRTYLYKNVQVTTGIFKSPAPGALLLRRFNLDGDGQADLENHGGRNKAVYAYPSEHYEFWHKEFPERELPWGMFGENLTTKRLLEEEACIGDRFRIGNAVVAVSQPRIPCYKLGLRFGRDDIVKRFSASRRSGIYFSVFEEGLISPGDEIERVHRDHNCISVADVNRAYADGSEHLPLLRRIVKAETLPPGIHEHLARTLASIDAGHLHSESKDAQN